MDTNKYRTNKKNTSSQPSLVTNIQYDANANIEELENEKEGFTDITIVRLLQYANQSVAEACQALLAAMDVREHAWKASEVLDVAVDAATESTHEDVWLQRIYDRDRLLLDSIDIGANVLKRRVIRKMNQVDNEGYAS